MEKPDNRDKQRIVTPEFRVSFPHVFKPSTIKGGKGEPKYSVTALFKKSQDLSAIKEAMKWAKIEAFGENKTKWPASLENPVQDGDEFPDREGYPGHWVVKFSSNQDYKPTVVDENVEEILDASVFYPGCYAKAQVYCRVWEFAGKRGIHFILDMVQKTRDGKPFSNKKSAKEVFAPIEGREDASSYEDSEEENTEAFL